MIGSAEGKRRTRRETNARGACNQKRLAYKKTTRAPKVGPLVSVARAVKLTSFILFHGGEAVLRNQDDRGDHTDPREDHGYGGSKIQWWPREGRAFNNSGQKKKKEEDKTTLGVQSKCSSGVPLNRVSLVTMTWWISFGFCFIQIISNL